MDAYTGGAARNIMVVAVAPTPARNALRVGGRVHIVEILSLGNLHEADISHMKQPASIASRFPTTLQKSADVLKFG